jgi:hypothetical protein
MTKQQQSRPSPHVSQEFSRIIGDYQKRVTVATG